MWRRRSGRSGSAGASGAVRASRSFRAAQDGFARLGFVATAAAADAGIGSACGIRGCGRCAEAGPVYLPASACDRLALAGRRQRRWTRGFARRPALPERRAGCRAMRASARPRSGFASPFAASSSWADTLEERLVLVQTRPARCRAGERTCLPARSQPSFCAAPLGLAARGLTPHVERLGRWRRAGRH